MSEQPLWSYVGPESFLFTPPITTPSISLLLYERDALKKRVTELEAQMLRWIPVTERLPEENGWYLVVMLGNARFLEFRPHANWAWWDIDDCGYCNVTHWMPMPPAPKEAK